jgi:hypothetical protein
MAKLSKAYRAIVDAVVHAVERDLASDVESVVSGARARPMPKLPAIWVLPEPATASQATFGDEEEWTLQLTLAAVARSDDPEAAAALVAELAARALSAALSDHRLGLEYVTDVQSLRFDGAARTAEQNRTIHWADATVRVIFTVEEIR